ncbi:MAG: hypothetical protein WDN69_23415 [Aliidongia sp.]
MTGSLFENSACEAAPKHGSGRLYTKAHPFDAHGLLGGCAGYEQMSIIAIVTAIRPDEMPELASVEHVRFNRHA